MNRRSFISIATAAIAAAPVLAANVVQATGSIAAKEKVVFRKVLIARCNKNRRRYALLDGKLHPFKDVKQGDVIMLIANKAYSDDSEHATVHSVAEGPRPHENACFGHVLTTRSVVETEYDKGFKQARAILIQRAKKASWIS